MKGQYLAIEAVLTFGMGIMLTIGAITAFNSYRDDIAESAMEKELAIVESEIREAVFQLKGVDSGHVSVELPDSIGESDYQIALNNGVNIFVRGVSYTSRLEGVEGYSFEGSTRGGNVKIYKSDNEFILRRD